MKSEELKNKIIIQKYTNSINENGFEIPVAFQKYTGKAETYITFHEYFKVQSLRGSFSQGILMGIIDLLQTRMQ